MAAAGVAEPTGEVRIAGAGEGAWSPTMPQAANMAPATATTGTRATQQGRAAAVDDMVAIVLRAGPGGHGPS
ncbi:hypothetical protein [Oryzobacter telluris]|uniref:hypothetical protein n=1 Tax=Oryzobacter telluris TaxID=3149179 RepID=UPI00370D9B41